MSNSNITTDQIIKVAMLNFFRNEEQIDLDKLERPENGQSEEKGEK